MVASTKTTRNNTTLLPCWGNWYFTSNLMTSYLFFLPACLPKKTHRLKIILLLSRKKTTPDIYLDSIQYLCDVSCLDNRHGFPCWCWQLCQSQSPEVEQPASQGATMTTYDLLHSWSDWLCCAVYWLFSPHHIYEWKDWRSRGRWLEQVTAAATMMFGPTKRLPGLGSCRTRLWTRYNTSTGSPNRKSPASSNTRRTNILWPVTANWTQN